MPSEPFYELQTMYSTSKKLPMEYRPHGAGKMSATEWYSDTCAHLRRQVMRNVKDGQHRILCAQAHCEEQWYLGGKPYYKLFSPYPAIFNRTSLDLHARYMKFPFPTFAVQFPQGTRAAGDDADYVAGVVVSRIVLAPAMTIRQAMKNHDPQWSHIYSQVAEEKRDCACEVDILRMLIYLRSGVDGHVGQIITEVPLFLWAHANEETTLESILDFTQPDTQAIVSFALRVALSVCFLATGGDKIIEPEIINKDFPAYLAAVNAKNTTQMKALEDRSAEKRGSRGYTVGRAEALLGRHHGYSDAPEGETTEELNRRLQYSHQRCAHFHNYWTGTGEDRKLVVKFIRQLTVKPELPVRPDQGIGHRTLKSAPPKDSTHDQAVQPAVL